jgi:hypothetical protein
MGAEREQKMSFGFGLGGRRDDTLIPAIVFTVLFFAVIVGMYVMIEQGRSRAYREVYGDATPDPAAVAESVGASLYDGGDGRMTARTVLLLTATDTPEWGLVASPDEAVNYLYYTRAKRHVAVVVRGSGRTSPVLAIIGPDGGVLARDENVDGSSRAELQADLPAEGHYTIRVSANAVDPESRSVNYSLEFATPGYYSPWEWEKLVEAAPVLVAVLIGVLVLFGKLFGFSVKRPVESLRWYLRQQAGLPDPPPYTYPVRTALVLPPPPENVSEFEADRDELFADLVDSLYFGHYYEEDEADDEV